MLQFLLKAFHSIFDPLLVPIGNLWRSEPIRLLYVVAAGFQAFATLSLGGDGLQAIIQGVGLALLGEAQRQRVFAPDTVQAKANEATFLPPGTIVDIGSPPSGDVASEGPSG